jgi:hypothetical protein
MNYLFRGQMLAVPAGFFATQQYVCRNP